VQPSSAIPGSGTGGYRPNVRMTERQRRELYGYLFILPTLIFFVIFIAIPFFRAISISMTEWAGYNEPRFTGLQNFRNMMYDRIFWIALKNTFVFMLATTVLQTVIPLLVAVLLNAGWRAQIAFRTILFLPVIISLVITGLLWRMIFDGNFGVINNILGALNLDFLKHHWLAEPGTVMPSIIMVSLWSSLGFYMVIFLAGLQSIPIELYEVASIDGANNIQKLVFITVPMLWPVTTVVMILNIIGGIKVFDVIYVMTTGGPNHASEVLGTYLYVTAFGATGGGSPSTGYAAAIGVVILILCLIGTIVQLRFTGKVSDVY
jgi:ABC-type sugar transport system permease subunit